MSVFSFIDDVLEVKKGQSITAFFTLKGSEEFLLDHFEAFPVMPGVLMLESMRQAASELWRQSEGTTGAYRLTRVEQVKFGQFVKPGSRIKLSVSFTGRQQGSADFLGRAHLVNEDQMESSRALQASFTMTPVK